MDLKLKELADHIGARLEGDPDVSIVAPAALDDAQPNQITFADDDRRLAQVRASRAGAIVVGEAFPPVPGRNLLRIDHPRLGFLLIMERFVAPPPPHVVHDSAVVSPAAVLGAEVGVGAGAVICADAHIGDRTQVGPGAVIGGGVRVGEDCVVGANATLLDGVRLGDRCIVHPGAVIGGEGFGFQWLGDHT
ncbi:MAG: LpxD N-terminal domain-containing protein [Gammaproteobacteria bacterium]